MDIIPIAIKRADLIILTHNFTWRMSINKEIAMKDNAAKAKRMATGPIKTKIKYTKDSGRMT
jgi:hypothetical protein